MYLKGTIIFNFLLLYFCISVLFPNFLLAFSLDKSNKIAPSAHHGQQQFQFYNSSPEQFVTQMSLEEKIGQLFIVGFPHAELDRALKDHIEKYHLGSFIFFKRNMLSTKETKKFTHSLQALSLEKNRIPALIAVDQEGGNVTRIETKPRMPYFFHLGDINNSELIYKLGAFTAKVLSDLGFNLNLAPVLDLADSSDGSFISLRSFGSIPSKVSRLGYSYSKGLLDGHVIPTAKHFPGLGSLSTDPHTSITKRGITLSELEQADLVPFREFSKLGQNSTIMLSHIVYDQIDPSKTPASFSSYIIDELLRKKVGFKGVVMTDDLHMKSSSNSITPSQAALAAIKAGADIVMLSWSLVEQRKSFEAIRKAVISGEISEKKLNEKVLRILTLKKSLGLSSAAVQISSHSTEARTPASLASGPYYSQSLQDIEVSIVKSKFNSVFLNSLLVSDKSICVASNSAQLFRGITGKASSQVKGFSFPTSIGIKPIESLFKKIDCEVYFLTVENLQQVKILNAISETFKKKVVIFNYTIPSALKNRHKFFSVIDLYGFSSSHVGLLSERIREFALLKNSKSKNQFTQNKKPTDSNGL